ncbi:MAG: QueT transporter family protein [Eubacteriales bacterium]
MRTSKIRYICEAGIIAALYFAITVLLAPISYGAIQVRISEALCVLPFFTPSAVPGLFIGCAIANVFGGNGLVDVIVGSLSTLLAAWLTYKIKNKYLAPLPAVVVNAITISVMLHYLINVPVLETMGYIALGQTISCYIIGLPLLLLLKKYEKHIFLLN